MGGVHASVGANELSLDFLELPSHLGKKALDNMAAPRRSSRRKPPFPVFSDSSDSDQSPRKKVRISVKDREPPSRKPIVKRGEVISPSPAVASDSDYLTESSNSSQGDGNFSTKQQKMTLDVKASDKHLGAKRRSLSPATPSSAVEAVLHGAIKDVAINSSVLKADVDMKKSLGKRRVGRTEEKGAKEYSDELEWVDGRQTKGDSDVQKLEADIAAMPLPSQRREVSFPVICSVDFDWFEKVVMDVLGVIHTEERSLEVRRRFHDYVKSGKLSAAGTRRSSDGGVESIVVKDKEKSPPPREDEEIKLCIPFTGSGRIQLRQHDLDTLEDGRYVDDLVIDGAIRVMMDRLRKRDARLASLTHVFNVHFLTLARCGRWDALHQWGEEVDVFTKRYLVFPVNVDNLHWYLAVLLRPVDSVATSIEAGQSQSHSQSEEDDVFQGPPPTPESQSWQQLDFEPAITPLLLCFDSSSWREGERRELLQLVKTYLSGEARARLNREIESNQVELLVYNVDFPLQLNSYDCGLYTLHAFDRFFSDPLNCLNIVIPSGNRDHPFWQNELCATRREWWREEMQELARQWSRKQKGDQLESDQDG